MLKARKYYVCVNGDNGALLHCEGCNLIPKAIDDRTFIGTCYTVNQALTVAIINRNNVNLCPVCLRKTSPSTVATKHG